LCLVSFCLLSLSFSPPTPPPLFCRLVRLS
jgi:hypothetical protein